MAKLLNGDVLFKSLIFIVLLALSYAASANSGHHLVFASANIQFVSEDHTDFYRGVAIELLDEMSSQMGFTYEIKFYPWSRAIQVMRLNQVDALIGVYYSDDRAKVMDFGKVAIYQDEIRLFSHYGNNFKWTGDINQLSNRSIALVRGGSYGRALDHFKSNMQVVEVSSIEQKFKLLLKDRVDFTANNVRNTWPLLQQLKLEKDFISHKPALTIQPGYFAFAKGSKNKELLKKFDQFMQNKNESGQLKALQQRFIPHYE